MAYDHSRKAGNLGDVWKHAVLVSVASKISATDSFRYLETHSGAPTHKLGEAGEWRRGIGRLLQQQSDPQHPYLVRAANTIGRREYPAGWSFFTSVLSERANTVSVDLCDISEDVAAKYAKLEEGFTPDNVDGIFHKTNGYSHARDAEADLVFLDPPYVPGDWESLTNTCLILDSRNIPFIAWYPVFWPTRPNRLVTEVGCSGWEVNWAPMGEKPSQNMKGCGMLVSRQIDLVIQSALPELQEVAELVGSLNGISIRRSG